MRVSIKSYYRISLNPLFYFQYTVTNSLKLILIFRTKFHELLSDFPNYETILMNGLNEGDTAGCACVTPTETYLCRLPDNSFISSAEIKAIGLGFGHI